MILTWTDAKNERVELEVRNVADKNHRWPIQLCCSVHGEKRAKHFTLDIPDEHYGAFLRAVNLIATRT